MQLSRRLPLICLLGLLVNLQGFPSHPINTGLMGGDDVDILKTLLRRLEESLPADTELDRLPVERVLDALQDVDMPATPQREDGEEKEEDEFRARLDEAAIREFLSAKNLKAVRNTDPVRRSSKSSCFGGRMDRIGSASSLGCNKVGKFRR
ncbi:hypothetical protein NHX12_013191 [Muraenolepis orangiensis]|uniref:B-type natriuretic peptide n=1 Tax=Muraenolepis orangiensis TaxID=630683 RepID=A0A9Q0DE92_9TELE|nr:hypothetical protein NHX12_013191 [Muraenolepis orangiensis]